MMYKMTYLRLSRKYLGRENIDPDDALDLALEHFNKFDVNEMTATQDYGYVSGLVADIEELSQIDIRSNIANKESIEQQLQDKTQQLNDYRLLFTAKNSLPFFFQDGGRSMTDNRRCARGYNR